MIKIKIKNKTVRKASLFVNLVLLIATITLAFYVTKLNMKLYESDKLVKYFTTEMISRDMYMGELGVVPAQNVVKGLKLPVASTSTTESSIASSPEEEEIKAKIKHYFPKSHVTMTAIANAESHFNNDSMNWNCYYNKDKSIVYTTRVKGSHSTFCKKEHRQYSWSIDCFVLMKNYVGLKECPKDVTLDEHLAEMAELSKKRSFQPWSSYNAGAHEKYLTKK
jgi:hypothetical protein